MISIAPSSTSVLLDVLFSATDNTMITLGNVTNSGVTWVYHVENQTATQDITVIQGTAGTWATGSMVALGTASKNKGLHQLSIPNAAIPASFQQKVSHFIANGTVSGGAMLGYMFELIGSDDTTGGLCISAPATSGTITLVSTLATGGTMTLLTNFSGPMTLNGLRNTATTVFDGLVNLVSSININAGFSSNFFAVNTMSIAGNNNVAQTADSSIVVNNATFGNAQLARRTDLTDGTAIVGTVNYAQTVGTLSGSVSVAPATSGTITLVQTLQSANQITPLLLSSTAFTAAALANAPTLSANITVTPISSTVSAGEVISDSMLAYQNAVSTFVFGIVDSTGTAVDLASKIVKFTASDPATPLTDVIYHDNGTTGGLTVGGASNSTLTLILTSTDTSVVRDLEYAIWDVTDTLVVADGILSIVPLSQ